MITDRELTQEERAKLARSSRWTALLFACLGVLIAIVGIAGIVRGSVSTTIGAIQIVCGMALVTTSWKPYQAYLKYKTVP